MALTQKDQDRSQAFLKKMILGFVSNASYLQNEGIGKLVSKPGLGRVVHFFYDAKLKAQLPYWDKFPLVIPLNYYPDGMLGLNLHYLPPGARLAFFDELLTLQSKKGLLDRIKTAAFGKSDSYDANTKIRATYPRLKDAQQFGPYKQCIKRYLSGHVRSPFLDVNPNHWEDIVALPTQRFQKSSPY